MVFEGAFTLCNSIFKMKRFLLLSLVAFATSGLWAQQLNNAGFEDWQLGPLDTVPAQWKSSDFGVARTAGAQGGWAVEVWNWYYYGKGYVMNELSSTGFVPQPTFNAHGGQAFAFRPVALTGFYRYLLGDNQGLPDSAYITLSFKRRNSTTQQTDSLSFVLFKLPPTPTFTPFSIPISLAGSVAPDSLFIALVSSVNGFCGQSPNCLYLAVDNLQFQYPTGLGNALAEDAWSLNTSSNHWKVETAEACAQTWVEVSNLEGKTLLRNSLMPYSTTLDASALPNGIYLIRLIKSNGETSLIKKVAWVQH